VLRIGLPVPAHGSTESIGPRQVVSNIANAGLIQLGQDGRPQPALAERWEYVDQGRTLRIFLRPDLKFRDGSPLGPGAVKTSLDVSRAVPARDSQFPMLRDIESIDVGGTYVSLRLKQPSILLLEDLRVPITKRVEGQPPITAGGFFADSETADAITLRANPFYHLGRPALDSVQVKTYPTVRAAWTSLMRDEVDLLYQVPNDAREFVEAEARVRVYPMLRAYVFSLVFNVRRPMFTSPLVRRALNVAVDRDAILEAVVDRRGVVAHGPIWPASYAYSSAQGDYAFDPDTADRLLARAGYPAERRPSGDERMPARLRFTCLIPANLDQYEQVAILLQKQFFDLGMDMVIEPAPLADFVARVTAGNYDAVVLDLASGRGLVVPYQLWHSASGSEAINTGYHGADAALSALRRATDDDALRDALAQFQEAIYADPPAVFLFWPETSRAVSRRFNVPESEPDVVATLPSWTVADAGNANE
jgi:peptide/nickel transport system substrate-binding protein